ncbi:hypothetical protein [Sphingobacterium sp. 1.A.4]|uniref:hypothetical protein n=1 Tax=Sphingobacterium sp. 1.A.4 TaxID=2044603 RepID=UPI000C0BF21D|nr:hypothetical protein [Sphingobacterium sp. 1.A.4]
MEYVKTILTMNLGGIQKEREILLAGIELSPCNNDFQEHLEVLDNRSKEIVAVLNMLDELTRATTI